MKIVKTTVKERIVGGKYRYKRISISTDFDIDAEPGKEVELVIMTREEWERYQGELTSLRERLEDCKWLALSQFEMCHRVLRLAGLQLPQMEEKTQQPTVPGPPPQPTPPQPIAVEVPQPRRRQSRRQRTEQLQRQTEQRPPQQTEPLTVPAELSERLLQNQWVKILRERQ